MKLEHISYFVIAIISSKLMRALSGAERLEKLRPTLYSMNAHLFETKVKSEWSKLNWKGTGAEGGIGVSSSSKASSIDLFSRSREEGNDCGPGDAGLLSLSNLPA